MPPKHSKQMTVDQVTVTARQHQLSQSLHNKLPLPFCHISRLWGRFEVVFTCHCHFPMRAHGRSTTNTSPTLTNLTRHSVMHPGTKSLHESCSLRSSEASPCTGLHEHWFGLHDIWHGCSKPSRIDWDQTQPRLQQIGTNKQRRKAQCFR